MGNSNVFNMDVFSKYSAKIYSQLQYKKSGIFSSDILIFSNGASLDLTPQLCPSTASVGASSYVSTCFYLVALLINPGPNAAARSL